MNIINDSYYTLLQLSTIIGHKFDMVLASAVYKYSRYLPDISHSYNKSSSGNL